MVTAAQAYWLNRKRRQKRAASEGVGGGATELPGFSYSKESFATWQSGLAGTGCTVDDLGVSSDGVNHLYGLQYGDAGKPVLMLIGTIHGSHEWRNAYILRQFMSYLSGAVAAPSSTLAAQIAAILATCQVYCIPLANPYGYTNTTRGNANSVDLNRNFDAGNWTTYDDSGDFGATKGSAPFSEAETVIIRDKVLALDPVGFIDFHIEGTDTGTQLEIVDGADELFWDALSASYNTATAPSSHNYVLKDPLPQAQQWARTHVASNGKKPMTATFEAGADETDEEKARLILNFALQFGAAMVDQVANGWPQATATVTTLQPAEAAGKDTQIAANVADGNYGTLATMGCGDSSGIRRFLLGFDLSSIPPGADVQSAIITLYCESETNTTDRTVGLHRMLKEWYEGAGTGATPGAGVDATTWNNRNHNGSVAWGAAGGQSGTDYVATASDSEAITAPSTAFTWDVTADVQAFLSGVYENYGWMGINVDQATASSRKIFSSSNSATAGNRPKLEVTAK